MFRLKRPCATCPFRRGVGSTFRFRPKRLDEIAAATAFQCHGTVDYTGEAPAPGAKPAQCAGLMAVLAREGRPNQIMQVAERLGALDVSTLDPGGVAYRSWDEARTAHDGREPADGSGEEDEDRTRHDSDGRAGESGRDA